CKLISLSRASYYRSIDTDIGTETPENLELMRLIDEEYTRHPFYGSRRITVPIKTINTIRIDGSIIRILNNIVMLNRLCASF
ncbi:MAG: hypothetical protein Q8R24_03630, partial [Legionellaceae bacterium]|nr:hypothetical protein [Legionellaceae bacterium]